MSDQPPSDPSPPEPSDDAVLGASAEDDLDSLLAAAADLAAEVCHEIGEPEAAAKVLETDAASSDADVPPGDDLDAQLAELERLAETARTEVGADEDAAPSAAESPDTDENTDQPADVGPTAAQPVPAGDVAEKHVDDPPDDLTHPAADGEADELPDAEDQPFTGSVDDVVLDDDDLTSPMAGEGACDAFGAPPARGGPPPAKLKQAQTPAAAQTHPDPSAMGSAPGSAAPVEREVGQSWPAMRARLLRQGERVALPAATGVVRLLECIDKPLSAVGERARTILGCVALATLGAAVVTLIWSLFR